MAFKLSFERLEQRENPSGTGGDGYALPPQDPMNPPPAPIVDPGTNPGQPPGTPPANPTNPPRGW